MAYDVVVFGAGIGGLTVAALLAKRGLSTCILERQSQVGGCIARVEYSGMEFEPGMGLYTGWEHGGIYERLFGDLGIDTPKTEVIPSDYVVRLPNDQDIRLKRDDTEFFEELRKAFPECAEAAVDFYSDINTMNDRPANSGRLVKSLRKLWTVDETAAQSKVSALAQKTSDRFQRFIDAQLSAFANTPIDRCSIVAASRALRLPRSQLYSIEGGISSFAERLAGSIKSFGSVVRLNSPVLRLAFSESGEPIGVQLLSGETVLAKRAIISNLTIWDTFGKLVGLNKTPSAIKSTLNKVQAAGVFVVYAAIDSPILKRLPGRNFLVANAESHQDENLSGEIAVTIREANRDGLCAATLKSGTEVASWFAFQESEAEYEQRDQAALETFWSKLHAAVPEFGSGIEVIETANPRTYYDLTRRKLGMVLGREASTINEQLLKEVEIPVSNVFMVGDTIAPCAQLNSLVESAFQLVARLTK